MGIFTIIGVLVVIAALFGYLNTRFLKLPNTIGLMLITLVVTLFVLASSLFNDTLLEQEKMLLAQIDFQSVLLDVMLSFYFLRALYIPILPNLKYNAIPF